MSGKGVPESGTIKMSDLKSAMHKGANTIGYSWTIGGSEGNGLTAPASATWCRLELYGAGGGGRGYGGTEYGGGGGGYIAYEFPVEGGVSQFGYYCGIGGTGGASSANGAAGGSSRANGIPGGGTVYAYGGGGGTSAAGGYGGTCETDIRGEANTGTDPIRKRAEFEVGEAGGVGTYYHGGDCAGPAGAAGGTSSGQNGSTPGGGGAGRYIFTSPYDGGDGGDGRVYFQFYTNSGTVRLRDFISGGSYLDESAAGKTKNIPKSGTLKLRDFLSVDEVGYNANNHPWAAGGTGYYSESDYDWVSKGGTAVASANLSFSTNSSQVTHNFIWGKILDRSFDNTIDTDLLDRFQIQFTHHVGNSVSGSATNTWITLSSGPKWYLNATRSTTGSTWLLAQGYWRFRRVDDNQEFCNVRVSMSATAEVQDDFDTK